MKKTERDRMPRNPGPQDLQSPRPAQRTHQDATREPADEACGPRVMGP